MTNSFVQVPPDGAGKKLYTQQHTVGIDTVQVQTFHLADPVFPEQQQTVNAYGASAVSFVEGQPSLDLNGKLRVSTAEVLGYYDNVISGQEDLYWDNTVGTASITHVPVGSYTNLSVGSTAGDKASRSTTRYHFYQPGIPNIAIQTLVLSDAGKLNNTRSWGLGDSSNALYWQLNDVWNNNTLTNFSVNIRSSASGSIVVRRVNQIDWNGDKLNGLGVSKLQLNLTGRMYFWIDYAWLGTGPTRFGVIDNYGHRVICHTFNNLGEEAFPYTQSGSYPLFWDNLNTGATSGSSDIRQICGAMYAESVTSYNFYRFSDIESGVVTVTTDTPVVSLKPKLTVNTKPNRTGIYPDSLSVYVTGGDVKLSIYEGGVHTGATWSITGDGVTQGDSAATAIANASVYKTFYISAGCNNIDISELYKTNDEGYHVTGDGLDSQTMTIVASKLSGTTVSVKATISYRELR